MTANYQQLWRKWMFYRNLLMATFALNVFCVVSGFVLSFNYWGFKQDLRKEHSVELQKLAASADLERHISELETLLYHTKSGTDRASVFREAEEWNKLKIYLTNSGLDTKHKVDENIIAQPKTALNFLKDIKTGLAGERKAAFENLSTMVNGYSDTTLELVIIAGLTLLFGLAIPAFLLWMVMRILKRTTQELRQAAGDIAREWINQRDKYGAEAFKNIEFWVQIALLAAQFTGRAAQHPMAQLTGEMAYLIREELEKSKEQKAA